MLKARLVQGEDYVINGVCFRNGIDVPIDDELKEVLSDNEQFEIIEEPKEEITEELKEAVTEELKKEDKTKEDKKGKGQQEGEA